MPTVVTDPMGQLVGGMVQGYHLAHQIKQQAMMEEAHQRNMAAADNEAQVKGIQQQMWLSEKARPVDNGLVQEGPASTIQTGLPGALGSMEMPASFRPVDKSRRFTYKGRDGKSQDYERLTPEELTKRQVDQASAMKHAGSTLIQTPEHLIKFGMPAQMYVPDEHLYQYAEAAGQLQPVDTPQAYREMGGPAQVPFKNLAGVTTAVGQAFGRQQKADQFTKAEDGKNQRAKDRLNKTPNPRPGVDVPFSPAVEAQRKRIANETKTPKDPPKPDRFKERQLENDQKALRDLEAKKDALWAEMAQERASSPGPKDDAKAFEKGRQGRIAGLDLRIRGNAESRRQLISKWQNGGQPNAAPSEQAAAPANPYR